jgi:hypothetical protein
LRWQTRQATEPLRRAGRGFVSPISPPDETHGREQEKHDQCDRGDRGRKRQEGYEGGAPKLRRSNDGVAKAACSTVEWARRIPVNPWVSPATPPPAITAAVHFTIGGASIMTAAETIVPATKAAGVAKVSSRLSTTGMMSGGD